MAERGRNASTGHYAPAEPEMMAEPAAVVTVAPGQVITSPPPAVAAETLPRLTLAAGMDAGRADAGGRPGDRAGHLRA